MSEVLRIDEVRLRDEPEEKQVVIEIELFNELQRTVHAHATPRLIHFDPPTGKLKVELSEENVNRDIPSKSLLFPKFKAIDPQRSSTMQVRLPRVMHKLGVGADPRVPGIETLPIYEAKEIEVLLGWSDTPFYPDQREGRGTPSAGLVEWQKGIARGKARRRGSSGKTGPSSKQTES